MARKNSNAAVPVLTIPVNSHLMYSADELYQEPTVVRYMDQDKDHVLVYHPEGFSMWVHVTQVWLPKKRKTAQAA